VMEMSSLPVGLPPPWQYAEAQVEPLSPSDPLLPLGEPPL